MITTCTTILAQTWDELISRTDYKIVSEGDVVDTILTAMYEYDDQGRKTKELNAQYWKGDIHKTTNYTYEGDNATEICLLNSGDTLIIKKTKVNDLITFSETKNVGYLTNGKYRKSEFPSVREVRYDPLTQTSETILYSDGRDTAYHTITTTQDNWENSSFIITEERNKKTGKLISKYIIQTGEDTEETTGCHELCSKRIIFQSDSTHHGVLKYSGSIYVEQGDTVRMTLDYETKLANGITCVTKEKYDYENGKPIRYLKYLNGDQLYLEQEYSWKNNEWIPRARREMEYDQDELQIKKAYLFEDGIKQLKELTKISWTGDKTEKLSTISFYKMGEKSRESKKLSKFVYR